MVELSGQNANSLESTRFEVTTRPGRKLHYSQIQGWFTWEWLCDFAVARASARAHFVEVGAWRGRSTAYLARRIKESGKNIRLDVVDTWKGTSNEPEHSRLLKKMRKPLYQQFLTNMRRADVLDLVCPVRRTSLSAATRYAKQCLDFVFIDADHTYQAVQQDLAAWFPKVREGGVFAGHDYSGNWPGVVQAVNEFATKHHLRLGLHKDCWVLRPSSASTGRV